MEFTIILPHYRNGKMSTYTLAQLLKYKGSHTLEIIIVDNNPLDGSVEYFKPFENDIRYYPYQKDRIQSHGCAFDYILPLITTPYFVTIESDSYPTNDKWLDYLEELIQQGYDCAGSLLPLSGGTYTHPAGTLYRKSVWEEAKKYCDEIEYSYFPNMSSKEGFDCHLMIHNSILDTVLENPNDYIELAKGYVGLSKEEMIAKRDYYSPVVNPFHNGMGTLQESIKTFGQRNTDSEVNNMLLNNRSKLINRIGMEPGQWFCYWQLAMGKKVAVIPTQTKWMHNRENQQQEYTLMENGFRHEWAGSAYLGMKGTELNDVYEFKNNRINKLYESLPEHQKINK